MVNRNRAQWRETIRNTDFLTAITLGLVPGVRVDNVFGYNSDIPATTPTDLWPLGGIYQFPSDTGQALFIKSTDPTDNQYILVNVLDVTFAEPAVPVVVQLNGTTLVEIPGGPYTRVNGALNADVTAFQGTVDIFNATETITYCRMLPEDQRSAQAIYTVPLGKKAHVAQTRGTFNKSGGSAASVIAKFFGRAVGRPFQASTRFGLQSGGGSTLTYASIVNRLAPAKTDIKVQVESTAASTDFSELFVVVLFDELFLTG